MSECVCVCVCLLVIYLQVSRPKVARVVTKHATLVHKVQQVKLCTCMYMQSHDCWFTTCT